MAQQYTNLVEFNLNHTTVAKAYNKVTLHMYLGKSSIKTNSTLLQLTVCFKLALVFYTTTVATKKNSEQALLIFLRTAFSMI